ncbi:hypothetical protein H6P81_006731 [Aristolochia fimbriata]|uniref:Uncharacterized protein n=1 Tax=Aristolochia fimbriata TaxID=158543 RepID=A0AAV7F205_ARIFI|nr:hypothetical protein H6P81_006731 [Aristolochia fimbriata]
MSPRGPTSPRRPRARPHVPVCGGYALRLYSGLQAATPLVVRAFCKPLRVTPFVHVRVLPQVHCASTPVMCFDVCIVRPAPICARACNPKA